MDLLWSDISPIVRTLLLAFPEDGVPTHLCASGHRTFTPMVEGGSRPFWTSDSLALPFMELNSAPWNFLAFVSSILLHNSSCSTPPSASRHVGQVGSYGDRKPIEDEEITVLLLGFIPYSPVRVLYRTPTAEWPWASSFSQASVSVLAHGLGLELAFYAALTISHQCMA